MKAIKKMGSPVRKMDGDKGQALADTSRGAQRMTLQEKCCISWACGFRPRSQNGGQHLGNLVVILDLELRPATCTVLAVAAAPCLLSALVAYIN